MNKILRELKHALAVLMVAALMVTGLFAQPETVEAATVSKPTLSSVTATTSGITVKWTKVSNGSGYQIYRKTGSGSYKKIKTISNNSTLSYNDTGLKNGTVYTYRVRAYKGSKYSSYSKTIKLKYLSAQSVKCTLSGSQVVLNWTKNSSASGYYVYRKTGSGSFSKITTLKKNTLTTWTDKTAVSGNTYSYAVRAYSGSYLSPYTPSTITICSHSWTLNSNTATCTAAGTATYKCSKCGSTYTKSASATGHSYTSAVTKAATCAAAGVKTYTCSKCGNKYTESIAKIAHKAASAVKENVKAATCTAAGSYDSVVYCSVCKTQLSRKTVSVPATGHSYTSAVTKAATCTAAGVRTYTCSNCKNSYTETIAATGHNYSSLVTSPTYKSQGYTTHTCSKCGDSYKDTYTDALVDTYITVGGTDYYLGEAVSALGTPDEKLTSTSAKGYQWYVYGTDTYKNFYAAGVMDGKVVALISAGPGFTYQGMQCGDQLTSYTSANCYIQIAKDKNDNNIVHGVLITWKAYANLGNFTAANLAAESKLILHLTNAFRAYHNLTPLVWETKAAAAAQIYSQRMADESFFSHYGPTDNSSDGDTPAARMAAQGVSWTACGENITMGTATVYGDAFDAYNNWVNSSGHRTNMLRTVWTYLGVGGGYSSSNGCTYFTQDFWR